MNIKINMNDIVSDIPSRSVRIRVMIITYSKQSMVHNTSTKITHYQVVSKRLSVRFLQSVVFFLEKGGLYLQPIIPNILD